MGTDGHMAIEYEVPSPTDVGREWRFWGTLEMDRDYDLFYLLGGRDPGVGYGRQLSSTERARFSTPGLPEDLSLMTCFRVGLTVSPQDGPGIISPEQAQRCRPLVSKYFKGTYGLPKMVVHPDFHSFCTITADHITLLRRAITTRDQIPRRQLATVADLLKSLSKHYEGRARAIVWFDN